MPASPLHHRRIDCGLTQFAVAHAARISCGRYSMIERRLVEASAEERVRISKALMAPEDALFGERANVMRG